MSGETIPEDIPADVWAAAVAVMNKPFEQVVTWEGPLIVAIARVILAERVLWQAELDVLRAALRLAELVLDPSYDPHHR
jgi:hypothetical protein